MRGLAAIALVSVAGCADLPPFERGVCGNFVIDPGEDCDDASAACQACALRCDTAACPDGYACGADRFCHAPSGVLAAEATGSVAFSGTAFAVTDIDRDGYGDVVGLSETSLTVTFGDPTGGFAQQASTLTPVVKGAGAFARFDDDDSLDVVLPTADGVVAYTSPRGALAPHEFAVTLEAPPGCQNQLGNPFFVSGADDRDLAILTAQEPDHKLAIALIDSTSKSVCPKQVQQICNISATSPIYDAIQVYDTTSAGVPSRVIAVVTGGAGGGLCVVNLVKQGAGYGITTITPPQAFAGRPTLVDLNPGGGCPSLIDSSRGPASLREYRGSGTPGACTLAASATPLSLGPVVAQLPPTATAIGHVTLEPPINDGKSYGKDALALSSGIYAILGDRSGSREMYRSDRELGAIGETDIDADGDIDAVAARPGFDDGDVLLRAGNAAFLLYRVATNAPLTGSLTGDFDGNGIGDVAYLERRANGDHLMVAFGTPDRPLPPVEVGAFTFVVGLVRLQLRDSTDPFGIVDDMVVLDLFDPTQNPRLTILHGSPQRSLLAFFDPRPVGATSTFAAVAAGNFIAGAPTDVLAVEQPPSGTAMLWPLEGTGGGSLQSSAANASSFDDCTAHPTAPLCGDSVRFVTWPLADHDVVIAIDDSGPPVPHHVAVIDPATWTPMLLAPDPLVDVPPELALRTIHAVDLDGDGRRELLVSFGVRELPDDGQHGAVLVCDVDERGMPGACAPLAARVPELAGWACLDAAPAGLRPRGRRDPAPGDPSQDLAVLCHVGASGAAQAALFHVFHDAGAFHATKLADVPGTYEQIGIGDVTGDGVDDLLAFEIDPKAAIPHLLVIPQCTSRDLACQSARGEGP